MATTSYAFRLVPEGGDAVVRTFREAGDAAQRFGSTAEAVAASLTRTGSTADAVQTSLGRAATATEGLTRQQAAALRALDRLVAATDPYEAALQKAAREEALLTRAMEAGLPVTERQRASLSSLASEYERVAAAANDALRAKSAADADRGQAVANRFAGFAAPASAEATSARQGDLDAYGAELDRVRAKLVPLAAAQQQYRAALAEATNAERVGAISAEEHAQVRDRLKTAFAQQILVLNGTKAAQDEVARSSASEAAEVERVVAALDGYARRANGLGAQLADLTEAEARLAQARRLGVTVTEEQAAAVARLRTEYVQAQAAAADSAQEKFNGAFGIKGPTSDEDYARRHAELEAYGAEMDRTRGRLVPLAAAQQDYRAALADVSQAERAGAVTTEEAAAARGRLKAAFADQVKELNGSADATRRETAEVERLTASLDGLVRETDPVAASLAKLTAAQKDLADAQRKGIATPEHVAAVGHAARAHEDLEAKAKKSGNALGLAGYQARNATAQLVDFGVQLSSGSGFLLPAIQQGPQLVDSLDGVSNSLRIARMLLTPTTVGFGLLAVGMTTAVVSAEATDRAIAGLSQRLRATRSDFADMARAVEANARTLAGSTDMSTADAREAGRIIGGARGFTGTTTGEENDLLRLTRQAEDVAKAFGITVPQAAERMAQAIEKPSEAARRMGSENLPTMNDALRRQIELLEISGQKAEAGRLAADAYARGVAGAAAEQTPFQRSLGELSQSFTSLWNVVRPGLEAIGRPIISGIASGFTALAEAIKSVSEAASGMRLPQIPDWLSRFMVAPGAVGIGYAAFGSGRGDGPAAGSVPAGGPNDLAARILHGEAAGQGERGLAAVAHVILNRAREASTASGTTVTPDQIVQARGQFEPWGNAATRERLISMTPETYAQARAIFAGAANGTIPDPTGGATHFYSPREQARQGRDTPTWDNGRGTDIGDHRFFRLGYTGQGRNGTDPLGGPDLRATREAMRGQDGRAEDINKLIAESDRLRRSLADPALDQASDEAINYRDRLAEVHRRMLALQEPMDEVRRRGELQAGVYRNAAGAARELAEAENRGREAARARGASPDEQVAQGLEERRQRQAELNVTLNDSVRLTNQNAADTRAVAAAMSEGAARARELTTQRQAEAEALRFGARGSAEYAEAVQQLVAAKRADAAANADLGTATLIAGQRDQIALLEQETRLVGLSTEARQTEIAVLKERQRIANAGGDVNSAASVASQENLRAIGRLQETNAQLTASFNEVGRIGENAFERVTQAIVDSGGSMKDLGRIGKQVFASMLSDFLKLGVANPLANAVLGGNRATLGGFLTAVSGGAGSSSGGTDSSGAPTTSGILGFVGRLFGGGSSTAAVASAAVGGGLSTSAVTREDLPAIGGTNTRSAVAAATSSGGASRFGGLGDLFSAGNNPLVPGYRFSDGIVGRFDRFAETGIGGFLDTPVSSTAGTTLTYGQAGAGALSIAGGAYGIYSGLQTGGPRGAAQVVGGAAGVVGGAAGIASGLGVGGAALAGVATVAPYVALIAAVVAMLLPAQKPSDATGTYTYDTATRTGTTGGLTGDRFSQGNRDSARGIAESLQTVADQIGRAAGLPDTVSSRFRIEAGSRDGLKFAVGENVQKFTNDEEGAKNLTTAATKFFLEQAAVQTPDENVRSIVNRKIANPNDAIAALDWYRTTYRELSRPFEDYAASQSSYARGLADLNKTYEDAIAKATELGLATAGLTARQGAAVADYDARRSERVDGTVRGFRDRAAAAAGNAPTIARRLEEFDRGATIERRDTERALRDEGVGAATMAAVLGEMNAAIVSERAALIRSRNDAMAEVRTTLDARIADAAETVDGVGRTMVQLERQFAAERIEAARGGLTDMAQLERAQAAQRAAVLRENDRRVTDFQVTLFERAQASRGERRTLGGTLNAFDRAAGREREGLAETMRGLGFGAEAMANGLAQLNEVLSLARAAAVEEWTRNVAAINTTLEDRLFAATTDTSGLGGALAAYDRQAAREREEAVRQGLADITLLERTQAAERVAIVRQSVEQMGGAYRGFLDGLRATPAGRRSPSEQYDAAAGIFERDAVLARGGDTEAAGRLTTSAETFLSASNVMFASSERFVADRARVEAVIGALPATIAYDRQMVSLLERSAPATMAAAETLAAMLVADAAVGAGTQDALSSGLGTVAAAVRQVSADTHAAAGALGAWLSANDNAIAAPTLAGLGEIAANTSATLSRLDALVTLATDGNRLLALTQASAQQGSDRLPGLQSSLDAGVRPLLSEVVAGVGSLGRTFQAGLRVTVNVAGGGGSGSYDGAGNIIGTGGVGGVGSGDGNGSAGTSPGDPGTNGPSPDGAAPGDPGNGSGGGDYARGGLFRGGRIIPFARGGAFDRGNPWTNMVVDRPTLFPMADGRTGLMGEAGKEAIMPLVETARGLGVRAVTEEGERVVSLARAASGHLAVRFAEGAPFAGGAPMPVLPPSPYRGMGGGGSDNREVVAELREVRRALDAANARLAALERQGGTAQRTRDAIADHTGATADAADRSAELARSAAIKAAA